MYNQGAPSDFKHTVFGWFKCWSSHVFNFNVNPNFPKEIKENAWKKGTVVNQLALLSRTCTSYFTDASAFLGQVKTFIFLRVRLLWSCSDAVRYILATGFFLLFSRVLGTFPPPHSNSVAQGIKVLVNLPLHVAINSLSSYWVVLSEDVCKASHPWRMNFIYLLNTLWYQTKSPTD